MADHTVTFPITDPAEILKLRAGDEVTVQGHIIGIRDRTQIRIFDEASPPMDLAGAFLLHTAPGVRKLGPGRYEKVCIGTTTSARMVRFTEGSAPSTTSAPSAAKAASRTRRSSRWHGSGWSTSRSSAGRAARDHPDRGIEEVAWEELMPSASGNSASRTSAR